MSNLKATANLLLLLLFSGHGADVKSVDWHPRKNLLVSGSKDNQQPVKLWDPKAGQSVATMWVWSTKPFNVGAMLVCERSHASSSQAWHCMVTCLWLPTVLKFWREGEEGEKLAFSAWLEQPVFWELPSSFVSVFVASHLVLILHKTCFLFRRCSKTLFLIQCIWCFSPTHNFLPPPPPFFPHIHIQPCPQSYCDVSKLEQEWELAANRIPGPSDQGVRHQSHEGDVHPQGAQEGCQQ